MNCRVVLQGNRTGCAKMYRITNIQAAVGCAQMERLEKFLSIKRHVRNFSAVYNFFEK